MDQGRNPGTYVAVHYIKLIDFTFGRPPEDASPAPDSAASSDLATDNTWDSTQLRLIYEYPDGREAAFDIHTSWVNAGEFSGLRRTGSPVPVRQWRLEWPRAEARDRADRRGPDADGSEVDAESHYNGASLEPWGGRTQRGYGVEVMQRFVEEVAYVEFGGAADRRHDRLEEMRALRYNDLAADRAVVAAVQAMEAILSHAAGGPGRRRAHCDLTGGWHCIFPVRSEPVTLYPN